MKDFRLKYIPISIIFCIFAVEKETKKNISMTKKVGTYYFARHRRNWGIFIVTYINNGIEMGDFVKDVYSYEDAVRTTYALNGWEQPKRINKKY